MLERVKILLGISDDTKDDLLTLLINQAIEEAFAFTHQDNLEDLGSAIVKMVVYNYNRVGTEGLDSEGYSGASFSYSSDYPESIMRVLRSKRKLVAL